MIRHCYPVLANDPVDICLRCGKGNEATDEGTLESYSSSEIQRLTRRWDQTRYVYCRDPDCRCGSHRPPGAHGIALPIEIQLRTRDFREAEGAEYEQKLWKQGTMCDRLHDVTFAESEISLFGHVIIDTGCIKTRDVESNAPHCFCLP